MPTQTLTTGETTKATRPSPGRNINPSGRMMRAIERDSEARIAQALDKLRRDLLRGVTPINVTALPDKLARQEVLQPFLDAMTAVIRDISLSGADWGREQVERLFYGTEKRVDIPEAIAFVWDVVNENAVQWARSHAARLVTGITEVTRRRLRKEIAEFVQNTETINQLAKRIKAADGAFGARRAKTIAVTEVTRAFAEGNRIAWAKSEVVEARRWNTNVDERVCPICGPLHNVVVGLDESFPGVDDDAPPAHPNCRCWTTPIVPDAEERETGLEQFGLHPTATGHEGADPRDSYE